MTTATVVSQPIIHSQIDHEPPDHILQSWRHEQANSRDYYLLRQTFLVAPDTNVPSSRLRQRIRDIYDERARALIILHYDPWTKEGLKSARAKTASTSTSTKDRPANIDVVRSHTIL